MSHGPDKLCRLSKQKQTRTKKSEKLAQTIKSNTRKFCRKHSITKLASGIVGKKTKKQQNTHQMSRGPDILCA
jgi:hypothetical protein